MLLTWDPEDERELDPLQDLASKMMIFKSFFKKSDEIDYITQRRRFDFFFRGIKQCFRRALLLAKASIVCLKYFQAGSGIVV